MFARSWTEAFARRGTRTLARSTRQPHVWIDTAATAGVYRVLLGKRGPEVGTVRDPAAVEEAEVSLAPAGFTASPTFLLHLHERLGVNVYSDFPFMAEAQAQPGCFMPIFDFRAPPPYGRIPEVDNVFGYVLVGNDGVMVPGLYEPNAMYRVVNSDGVIMLSDHMQEKIL